MYVYLILRGKDLETGDFSNERRDIQFSILKKAQAQALDLTNWHEFHKVLIRAGFRSRYMITSDTAVLYSYIMFLIGRQELKVDPHAIRDILAKWFL